VPVLCQWNARVICHYARHAGRPKQFITNAFVSELVNLAKFAQRFPGVGESRGHKLEQRFREIGRNVAIGQCRAQRARMRRVREMTVLAHAQRLFLDAFQAARKNILGTCRGQPLYSFFNYPFQTRFSPVTSRPESVWVTIQTPNMTANAAARLDHSLNFASLARTIHESP